jgi:hypothetical protein
MLGSGGANRLVAVLHWQQVWEAEHESKLRSISNQRALLVHHHHGRINDRFSEKIGPLACKRQGWYLEVVEQIDSLQSFIGSKFGK